MLRIYFLQQWYGLADELLEETIYDSQATRAFVGINLSVESVPDATTLLKFRHLLESHKLTRGILEELKGYLAERRLLLREGTIVDATIIAAPSSTKNQKGERDPEMHQTKKGNQWRFGMKAHIIRNHFRYRKTRYRGLAKNTAQLETLSALANLVIAKRSLLSGCRA